MNRDLIDALDPVVRAFESLGVGYSVVGSVASSVYGKGRSTYDIDVVADLHASQIDAFVDAIAADYYVDRDVVQDAVQRRALFNVIHERTMYKVDVYVLTDRAFDRETFARRRPAVLGEEPGARPFNVDAPEDVLLHKLEWYRAGGEVSDRQWHDIVGLIEVQHGSLDRAHLDRWAAELGVSDLLARAYRDAKL